VGVIKRFAATALLLALSGLGATVFAAPVDVFAVASPLGGGVFHWDFSVINNSVPDLFLVTVVDAPLADPLIDGSLTAPAGFLPNYDGGLGLLDFIADVAIFFPLGETSFFSFDSMSGPGTAFTSFEAFDIQTFPDPVFAGQVNVTQPVPVPEPGESITLATGLAVLAFWLAVSKVRKARAQT